MWRSVGMTIHDPAGRTVATLLDRTVLGPGPHHARWEATEAPCGLYLARLEVDGEIATGKILRVR